MGQWRAVIILNLNKSMKENISRLLKEAIAIRKESEIETHELKSQATPMSLAQIEKSMEEVKAPGVNRTISMKDIGS